jgi:hypothetical protein
VHEYFCASWRIVVQWLDPMISGLLRQASQKLPGRAVMRFSWGLVS